eukprot:1161469-Pelagomonas_calceolata.AAC.50
MICGLTSLEQSSTAWSDVAVQGRQLRQQRPTLNRRFSRLTSFCRSPPLDRKPPLPSGVGARNRANPVEVIGLAGGALRGPSEPDAEQECAQKQSVPIQIDKAIVQVYPGGALFAHKIRQTFPYPYARNTGFKRVANDKLYVFKNIHTIMAMPEKRSLTGSSSFRSEDRWTGIDHWSACMHAVSRIHHMNTKP